MTTPRTVAYIFVSTVLLAMGFFVPKAYAANHTKPSITVAPFLQRVEIGANQPIKTMAVTFTNDSKFTQELTISVADFGTLDDTGGVAFVGGDFGGQATKYGLSSWLTLDRNRIKIEPGKKAVVTAAINNRPDLAPGGHYAAIIGTVVNSERPGNSKVEVNQKISALLFAVKTGGEKYDLALQDISTDGGLFRFPTEVSATLRSTGNVHVVPRGIVYVKDKSGKVLSRGVMNLKSGLVLPDTQRTFTVPLAIIEKPHILQKDFVVQVDYRYEGYADFASQNLNYTYINPLLFVIALPVILFLWALRNYLSYIDFKKPKILDKNTKRKQTNMLSKAQEKASKKVKKINITKH